MYQYCCWNAVESSNAHTDLCLFVGSRSFLSVYCSCLFAKYCLCCFSLLLLSPPHPSLTEYNDVQFLSFFTFLSVLCLFPSAAKQSRARQFGYHLKQQQQQQCILCLAVLCSAATSLAGVTLLLLWLNTNGSHYGCQFWCWCNGSSNILVQGRRVFSRPHLE